jgi:hypothetical protein
MSGTGQRSLQTSTRLSGRVTVRDVDTNDPNVQDIAEIIDTRQTEGQGGVPRGDHATLVLYAILEGGTTAANIALYGRASDEESSSSPASGEDEWCYYDDWAVDAKNLMVVLPDMPASEYKVMVTGITGGGTVAIREQHSA